jgi:hypothetical protein
MKIGPVRMSRLCLFLFIAAFVGHASKVLARTVYVDQAAGNDANGGLSPDDPVATLTRGAGLLAGGDVMIVGPGVDYELLSLDGLGTSASLPVWIRAEPYGREPGRVVRVHLPGLSRLRRGAPGPQRRGRMRLPGRFLTGPPLLSGDTRSARRAGRRARARPPGRCRNAGGSRTRRCSRCRRWRWRPWPRPGRGRSSSRRTGTRSCPTGRG